MVSVLFLMLQIRLYYILSYSYFHIFTFVIKYMLPHIVSLLMLHKKFLTFPIASQQEYSGLENLVRFSTRLWSFHGEFQWPYVISVSLTVCLWNLFNKHFQHKPVKRRPLWTACSYSQITSGDDSVQHSWTLQHLPFHKTGGEDKKSP